ncbi:DUF222 domain-containing protein [Rhodococcus sp. NPDC127530]|uniref:DUF222 domain-containing protein n=1 Tax=unclassified Rhodococcus (in: high G+C Gram-positive bacteria) TaxID=192944 RepID=UPI003634D79E
MGDSSSSEVALDAAPPGIVAIEALRVGKSVLAQAQYRQVVAVTEFYDLCCDEDERRGINPAHSGSHTSVEVSVALGMNEPVVTAWIDLGLDLRHRLHGTRVAFAAGRIDLDQARVIAAVLAGVSDSKLEQLETAILDGRSLPPSKLRARARRLIARHDAVRPRPPRERWSHRRVESRVPVPTSPPAENRRLLDRPPDRRREPRMDHAAR